MTDFHLYIAIYVPIAVPIILGKLNYSIIIGYYYPSLKSHRAVSFPIDVDSIIIDMEYQYE